MSEQVSVCETWVYRPIAYEPAMCEKHYLSSTFGLKFLYKDNLILVMVNFVITVSLWTFFLE